MYQGANVLVAGGASFVGSNLAQRLLGKGCRVRATLKSRPPVIQHERLEYVQADLTKMEDCQKAVKGMDYVFMCAASTAGAAVMASTPLIQVTPNVVMNAQMLEASYKEKVKKFVFISSSAAYPPSGDRPVKEEEMFLGDPFEAYYAVGWMKRYAEILCYTYAKKIKNPMATVVVRPSNIYGPFDDFNFNSSHVTAALIRRVAERQKPFKIWGNGKDVRDIIYIDDFIDGLLLAFEKTQDHLAVNIALGEGHTITEILNILLEVGGYQDAVVEYDPTKPSMIPIRLVDISLAKKELGFLPKVSVREGLKKSFLWYLQTMKNGDPRKGMARGMDISTPSAF